MTTTMTRKQFLQLGVGATAATLVGCGDDGGTGNDASTGASTGEPTTGGTTAANPTGESTGTPGTSAAESTGMPGSTGAETGTTAADGSTGAATSTGEAGTSAGESTTGAVSGEGTSSGGTAELCADGADSAFDLHPHTLMVSAADIMAGAAQDYVAGGGHTHPVHLSAADFDTLLSTGTVVVTAGAGGFMPHEHTVTITCV